MAETFDRSHRRYRLFEMLDGSRQWWTVDASNMPGDQLTDDEVAELEDWLSGQPFAPDFWRAFEEHRKATIYGDAR